MHGYHTETIHQLLHEPCSRCPPEAHSSRHYAQVLMQGPLHPTLKANPFPKVSDSVCRLPLPTLFRRPEAANLGDLLRIRVRPGARLTWSPRGFQGSAVALRTPQSRGAFRLRHPFLRASRFQGHEALQRKENSSRGHRRRPPLRSRRRTASSARREAVLRVRVREC